MQKTTSSENRHIPWRTISLFLGLTALVLIPFFLFGDAIDLFLKESIQLAENNRFLVALILFLILASDIILPIPSSLSSALCGFILGPFLGFGVSFAAMSVTCLVGYQIGCKSSRYAKKLIGESDFEMLRRFHESSGTWILLGLRPVPVLAEASLVFAGIARMSISETVLFVSLGNACVSLVYVLTGAYFSVQKENTWVAFLVCMAISGIFFLVRVFLRPQKTVR